MFICESEKQITLRANHKQHWLKESADNGLSNRQKINRGVFLITRTENRLK